MEENKLSTAEEPIIEKDAQPQEDSTYSREDPNGKTLNSEEILGDSVEIDISEYSQSRKSRLHLAVAVTSIYLVSWLVWYFCNDLLWESTIEASIYLSHQTGFLNWLSWFSSGILYQWHFYLPAILILFAPRKDRALTSGFVYLVSYLVRQYIRLLIHENRPIFESKEIKKSSYGCSFGMPSGHSEGITLLYSLIAYNFMSIKPTVAEKLLICFLVWSLCFCVYFSRFYYGMHSYLQIINGACQGWLFFCWFLYLEAPLNQFFRQILNSKEKATLLIWRTTGCITLVSLLLWYFWFDVYLKGLKIYHETCHKCFIDENKAFRVDLGRGLIFGSYMFGLSMGIATIEPYYKPTRPSVATYKAKIFSLPGLKKFGFMLVVHLPLLTSFIGGDPDWIVLLNLTSFTLVGFLVGHLSRICQIFKCDFRGDIVAWTTPDGLSY